MINEYHHDKFRVINCIHIIHNIYIRIMEQDFYTFCNENAEKIVKSVNAFYLFHDKATFTKSDIFNCEKKIIIAC